MQGVTKPVFKLHWIGIRISLIWSLYNICKKILNLIWAVFRLNPKSIRYGRDKKKGVKSKSMWVTKYNHKSSMQSLYKQSKLLIDL